MPAENLKLRTFRFAVEVGKLVQLLPYSILNRHYFGQITRSSSSTAANYRAAQRAKSDADFLELLLVFNAEYEKPITDICSFSTSFS